MTEKELAGWKEAAIAWAVCASIHREYAKGKDPLFKTRQSDFIRHGDDARAAMTGGEQRADEIERLRALLLEVLERDSGNDVPHDLKMRIDAAVSKG